MRETKVRQIAKEYADDAVAGQGERIAALIRDEVMRQVHVDAGAQLPNADRIRALVHRETTAIIDAEFPHRGFNFGPATPAEAYRYWVYPRQHGKVADIEAILDRLARMNEARKRIERSRTLPWVWDNLPAAHTADTDLEQLFAAMHHDAKALAAVTAPSPRRNAACFVQPMQAREWVEITVHGEIVRSGLAWQIEVEQPEPVPCEWVTAMMQPPRIVRVNFVEGGWYQAPERHELTLRTPVK